MTSIESLPENVQRALATDMTIDITTTGRRSGMARRIEIWFMRIEDSIYITGTPGPRDWFANLAANPKFVFHLKETTVADLDATGHIVSDPEERRRLFTAPQSRWYGENSESLDALIESAPVVRVEFD